MRSHRTALAMLTEDDQEPLLANSFHGHVTATKPKPSQSAWGFDRGAAPPVYFDFLQSHGVSIDQPEPLKTTASQICQGFDDGLTFTQVGGALMQRGESPHEATIQIFGAVEAYCPAHDPQLNVA